MKNKHHIDRIVKSYQDNPGKWSGPNVDIHDYSYKEVYAAYISVATGDILISMGDELHHEIVNMGWVVRAAILCLVAFDDCGYLMESELSELKILAQLGDRRAILLYWACHILKETK